LRKNKLTLETSKTLGGIGAILIVIGLLPVLSTYTYGVLTLVGAILVLIALNGLGNYYHEKGIFSNAIYALIIGIVGVIVTAIVAVIAVLTSLTSLENFIVQLYPNWTRGDWGALSGMTPTVPSNPSSIDFSGLGVFIAAIAVAFIVFVAFAVVAAYFLRRSLKQLSAKSAVGLFGTAGLIIFIGAFLLIALIIPGYIVIWIGVLILAIAFFQMKPQPEQPATPTQSYLPPTPV
jgi:uncharacterized membrane protein